MSGQANFTQIDSPTAPTAGITVLSFPATSTNQLKWVDADGGTNIIAGGGFTLTVPATGTAALAGSTLAQFAATTSAQLAGVLSDETGTGLAVFATSPTFTTQITTPAIVAPAALTVTPAAGSNLNVELSTTGDFAVNTSQFYVDTSTGRVGIGTTTPGSPNSAILEVLGGRVKIGDGTNSFWFFGGSSGSLTAAHILSINSIPLAFATGSAAPQAVLSTGGFWGIATTAPTNILSLGGNAARTMWMERHTTANTAGNSLTVQAGGATSGATDKAGGDLILMPGASTGTGRTNVRLQGYSRGASGTSDNTAVDRLIIPGAVTLTDAATSMFEVALASGAMCGGYFSWTIRASNGTDHQAYSGITTYSAVNKATVYTTAVTSDAANDAKSVSTGTLTVVFSILTGASKITLQCTPTGSLTETTYTLNYTLVNNSPAAITIL